MLSHDSAYVKVLSQKNTSVDGRFLYLELGAQEAILLEPTYIVARTLLENKKSDTFVIPRISIKQMQGYLDTINYEL